MDHRISAENETDQMFEAIGRAITIWTLVESEVCNIFTICTGDAALFAGGGINFGNSSIQTAVFFSVETFRGKLGLVNASLPIYVQTVDGEADHLKADWVRLSEKARKLSLRRNKLAHFTVIPSDSFEDSHVPPRLAPPHGSLGYYEETGWKSSNKTLTLHEVKQLEMAFYVLKERLSAFSREIVAHEALFDKYVRQLRRRIQSHSHTNQSRRERLARALSSLE
jgi:hypothetical protein